MTARNVTAMRRLALNECQICGGAAHHRHHIVPRSLVQNDDIENLMGLCHHCHRLVHEKQVDIGVYLTRSQGAKAVLLMGTVAAAYGLLYPSTNWKRGVAA